MEGYIPVIASSIATAKDMTKAAEEPVLRYAGIQYRLLGKLSFYIKNSLVTWVLWWIEVGVKEEINLGKVELRTRR